FVRGDAVAAIMILFINLIGGLIVGTWQHGMTLAEAAQNYTLLTIGDGLVAQIPALVISVAAGLVVSRVSTDRDIGREVVEQLARFPKVFWIAAGIVGLFGIVPGMPHLPFLAFAAVLGATGWWLTRQAQAAERKPAAAPAKPPESEELDVGVVELVEPLEVEIGYRLVGLVDKEKNGGLLRRLRAVRKQVSREFGFLVPVVHVRDNPDLKPANYRIMVYGVERATGEIHPDRLLAIPSDRILSEVPGIKTRDPVFGRPAVWIAPAMADQARASGHTVFDAAVVIATHFERVVKNYVEALFGRSELDALLTVVGKQSPKLIEELTPKLLTLSIVHKVLSALLAERIPLRSLRTIIVTLIEEGAATQDVRNLLKALRIRLAGFIVQHVFGAVDELKLMALEPELERLFQDTVRLSGETTEDPSLEPALAGDVRAMASAAAIRLEGMTVAAALVVRPELRLFVSQLLRPVRPWIWVFSYAEIPAEKRIKVVELLGRQPDKAANARR
ncbi:MAG TPA: FHIPEP family type III secretion protein, partial [Stellaceae bacterium]|nr:FHIPEP family type III secretion protein [Stellaceae bacterium]